MNFRGNMNFNRREIDLPDDGTFTDERIDWGLTELVAYSLADHWSVGIRGEVRKMTRVNQNLRWEFTPALEYSFFPYEEATRRAFTFFYRIGPAYRSYIEETVFGELSETRWEEALEIEFSQRQPWGDASIDISGSHFLHNTDLYNVSLGRRRKLPDRPGAEHHRRGRYLLGQRPDLSSLGREPPTPRRSSTFNSARRTSTTVSRSAFPSSSDRYTTTWSTIASAVVAAGSAVVAAEVSDNSGRDGGALRELAETGCRCARW